MDRCILILTEYFDRGGLETSILSEAASLRALGAKVCLATGSGPDRIPADAFDAIQTNLAMGPTVSFATLRRCLDDVVAFARAQNVTAIHAHPFHSLNVGFLAATEMALPFAITLHGPASIAEMSAPVSRRIFRSGVLRAARRTFCVSPETMLRCRAAGGSPTLLRNTATVAPRACHIPLGKPWMWAGRLDDPKSAGLLDLCQKLRGTGHELHVYGDGPSRAKLEETIAGDPSLSFVVSCGWRSDLETVYADHSVVAGMGRVVIEAAAQGIPCLLVGYDGVKDFLHSGNVAAASFANFSGRGLETVTDADFAPLLARVAQRPQDFDILDWIRAEHDAMVVWKRFLELVEPSAEPPTAFARNCLDVLRFCADPAAEAWSDTGTDALLIRLAKLPTSDVANPIGGHAALSQATLLDELDAQRRYFDTILQAERARATSELAEHRARWEAELSNARTELTSHFEKARVDELALARCREELNELRRSISWRITAPLRGVARAAKRSTAAIPGKHNG